ncbi:YbjN domain-containing protein [Mycobacterium sp. Marseille-P9652]|uniref:YbjN domain-containing protein n=1 Tax=Mycobacterium sp. Marseille-P9652 TaxID=2654950 RepID=UPI0012E7914A|nr:YbjN domain-containing protein [Mycobacterium sp. Marseille-P9652]
MTSEPLGAKLIESYLQTRGSRYFRGRHDGEFFYVANTRPRRLHVHLEMSADNDVLVIRVSPASFFPAAQRSSLTRFVDAWNAQNREVTAILHDSSDPERIGVVAHRSQWIPAAASFDDFATFVDGTLADAIELFGELALVADLSAPALRDAS